MASASRGSARCKSPRSKPRRRASVSTSAVRRLASSTIKSSRNTRRVGQSRRSLSAFPPAPHFADHCQAAGRKPRDAGHLPPAFAASRLFDVVLPGGHLDIQPGQPAELFQHRLASDRAWPPDGARRPARNRSAGARGAAAASRCGFRPCAGAVRPACTSASRNRPDIRIPPAQPRSAHRTRLAGRLPTDGQAKQQLFAAGMHDRIVVRARPAATKRAACRGCPSGSMTASRSAAATCTRHNCGR